MTRAQQWAVWFLIAAIVELAVGFKAAPIAAAFVAGMFLLTDRERR